MIRDFFSHASITMIAAATVAPAADQEQTIHPAAVPQEALRRGSINI